MLVLNKEVSLGYEKKLNKVKYKTKKQTKMLKIKN